ncbi:MAG TPA: hypothetical protein GX524_05400 [Firmicutes bacterium]|jgi:hypothetical protein|nr:hypothetical protein [Bacillota bacterium]
MSSTSPLLILIPLSILTAVVAVERFIVLRARNVIAGMILPLALGSASVYYLFFFREERPTMKGGMYGTFYLVCCLVSFVTFLAVKFTSNKE